MEVALSSEKVKEVEEKRQSNEAALQRSSSTAEAANLLAVDPVPDDSYGVHASSDQEEAEGGDKRAQTSAQYATPFGGATPLHLTCRNDDNAALVTFMLSKGADPDWKDGKGETPSFYAVATAAPNVLRTLLLKGKASCDTQDAIAGNVSRCFSFALALCHGFFLYLYVVFTYALGCFRA